jgi:hypothetical protein
MVETIAITFIGYLLLCGLLVNAILVIRGLVDISKQMIKGGK